MADITLTNIIFSTPSAVNQTATIEYKLTVQPDSSYVVWTNSALVLTDGYFSPPVVISGLLDGQSYRIKVTLNCNESEAQTVIDTPASGTTACVPPSTTAINFTYGYTENSVNTDFSAGTVADACNGVSYMRSTSGLTSQSYVVYYTSLVVGQPVYTSQTVCNFLSDGNYATDVNGSPTIYTVVDGYITAINTCTFYTQCATCSPTMTSSSSTPSNLSAGAVTSAGCTVGAYVIDWYLNTVSGSPAFTSGSSLAADPSVTAVHPFTNEIVQGGTWHPVIRSIYLNSVKYVTTPNGTDAYSPDLRNCLPTVVVNSLSCSNGGSITGYSGSNYAHKLTYNNTTNSSTLAARSFRFDLDATNRYFAWQFVGYNVSDSMKITHVSPVNNTSTQLEYWKVGNDVSANNVTVNPKTVGFADTAKITSLTGITFATGDYLRIDITPSSNANTNWDFYCKCLSSVTCNMPDGSTMREIIAPVTMTWNAANCQYEMKYSKNTFNAVGNDIWNYHHPIQRCFTGCAWSLNTAMSTNTQGVALIQKTDYSTSVNTTYYVCAQAAGSYTVTKSGATITVVFSNISDYNVYKNGVAAEVAASDFVNDPTDYHYYRFWFFNGITATSCGDSAVGRQFYTHYLNIPQFDDATKTMTYTTAPKTSSYVSTGPCDNLANGIANYCNACTNSYNNANFSDTTYVYNGVRPVIVFRPNPVIKNETNNLTGTYMTINDMDVCDLQGSFHWSSGLNQWEQLMTYSYDRAVITDNADPLNNWEFWRKVNKVDGSWINNTANELLIYKVVGGVVTVNNIAAYNAGTLTYP